MGNVEGLMTKTYVFQTDQGQPFIYDAELAYSNLLFCSREGVEYDVIVSNSMFEVIGSRQVQHSISYGYLKFATDFNPGETVQIIIGDI